MAGRTVLRMSRGEGGIVCWCGAWRASFVASHWADLMACVRARESRVASCSGLQTGMIRASGRWKLLLNVTHEVPPVSDLVTILFVRLEAESLLKIGGEAAEGADRGVRKRCLQCSHAQPGSTEVPARCLPDH